MASVFSGLFDLAMRIEREQFLEAGHYERTPLRRRLCQWRQAQAAGHPGWHGHRKRCPRRLATTEPFYPQSLERGRRSSRAVMLAVAEMYVKGVSTRDAEAVMKEFGIESLSSTQVSRAAKLLDDELEAWRTRPLGEIRYLIVDARYEKVREGGVVRDAAVLSAIGIGPDERRRVLGVSCALSEAEVHWAGFPGKSDQPRYARCPIRGLRRPRGPARGAQGGAHRRHLATLPVPSGTKTPFTMRPRWRSASASARSCGKSGTPRIRTWQPKAFAAWSKVIAIRPQNWPPGLKIMSPMALPSSPCRKGTAADCAHPTPWSAPSNRRSSAAPRKCASFQMKNHSKRLVSAVLVEIDDKWASADKAYIKWECQDD